MLQNISAHLSAATAPPPIAMGKPSLHLPKPPCYNGDIKACRGFLNHCTIHFEVLTHQFVSDHVKEAFIVPLLSSKALMWTTPLWEPDDPMLSNLQDFVTMFWRVF